MQKRLFFYSAILNFFLVFLISLANATNSVSYSDVVVVVNINDTVSVNIGNYFMQQRNIPATNLIRVNAPSQEEISATQFQALRQQIEDTITARNLKNSINYIVTTKGVPLKIYYGGTDYNPDNRNASVDNELMMILGHYNTSIGSADALGNWITHPYFGYNDYFSSTIYNIYLVTRLTGYTQADVFSLIDNSGPNTFVNKSQVKFVLDPVASGALANFPLNTSLSAVSSMLQNEGWLDTLNPSDAYVYSIPNVLGYWSWGSNCPSIYDNAALAKPNNTWSKASIAETGVSTSARSFNLNPPGLQSLIADLIAEGVTGVSGYVYEPYAVALADPGILFQRYTDDSKPVHYNLAESFYMASPFMGWMQVVVGDPKTSIVTNNVGIKDRNSFMPVISVFPNPSSGIFNIQYQEKLQREVTVFDATGKMVYSEWIVEKSHQLDLTNLPAGFYFLKSTLKNGAFDLQKLQLY